MTLYRPRWSDIVLQPWVDTLLGAKHLTLYAASKLAFVLFEQIYLPLHYVCTHNQMTGVTGKNISEKVSG